MGTQLGALTSAAMTSSADTDCANFVNQWANWAIQEIWNDRPWPFRVRELPVVNTAQYDYKVLLPSNFDHPREFRIITGQPNGRKLFRMTDELLRRKVMDPTDPATATEPRNWIYPILSDTYDGNGNPIYSVRIWPPADGVYPIGGSYYFTHPVLGPADFILMPSKWDNVIVDRLRIYIKEFEDEMDVTPWEKRFERSLNKMRNDIGRKLDALPSWKPEKFLTQIDDSFVGVGRDVDLGE